MIPRPDARVLFIRPEHIGDVLLSTPAIEALKRTIPSARVTVLAATWTRELLVGNPFIEEVIVYDHPMYRHESPRGRAAFLLSLPRLASRLRRGRFDIAVDFQERLSTRLITWASGARLKVGFRGTWRSALVDLAVERPGAAAEMERGLALVRALGANGPAPLPRIYLTEEEDGFAGAALPDTGEGTRPWVALLPGAPWPPRRWAPERFRALAQAIYSRFGASLVFLGSRGDAPVIEEVRGGLRAPSLSLAGRTTLRQAAALLQRCRMAIGVDSGLLHVAYAMGTPLVALFGPGDHRRWGHAGGGNALVRLDLPCSPCPQDPRSVRCWRGRAHCMEGLELGAVLAAAEGVWRTGAR